ncbi:MAG: nitroreductase family protein [Candidatus Methanoperedens sp.]|nr:nitroreductase family protein [Candidatus Methanoperedens sp.]
MAKSSKDVIEIIKTRRCVRQFLDKEILDDDIKFLIDCAGYAPSGLNMQPWAFLVIKNKDKKLELSEICKKSLIPHLEGNTSEETKNFLSFLKQEGSDMFYGAPVIVIILGNRNAMTAVYDCAMAAQTMMLAAQSIGIGSCWIGGAQHALMDEKLLMEIGAPEGYIHVAPLIFGYPKGETKMPERIKPKVIWVK